MAFVLGLEAGRVAYAGPSGDVFNELLEYMLPAWADKGGAAEAAAAEEEEEEEGGSDSVATRHAAVPCVGPVEQWVWWERACVFVLVAQVLGLVVRRW